jgi:hypothetical protein
MLLESKSELGLRFFKIVLRKFDYFINKYKNEPIVSEISCFKELLVEYLSLDLSKMDVNEKRKIHIKAHNDALELLELIQDIQESIDRRGESNGTGES